MATRRAKQEAADQQQLTALLRRHSTATVLFHHAMAERVGLGPSDLKCLDLLLQHKDMTGSRLAAITGLTTGAITAVVNRLEGAGYVRRRPDPADGRRQRLEPVAVRIADVGALFTQHGPSYDALVTGMDADQIATVIAFLARATEGLEQRSAALRAASLQTYSPTNPTN